MTPYYINNVYIYSSLCMANGEDRDKMGDSWKQDSCSGDDVLMDLSSSTTIAQLLDCIIRILLQLSDNDNGQRQSKNTKVKQATCHNTVRCCLYKQDISKNDVYKTKSDLPAADGVGQQCMVSKLKCCFKVINMVLHLCARVQFTIGRRVDPTGASELTREDRSNLIPRIPDHEGLQSLSEMPGLLEIISDSESQNDERNSPPKKPKVGTASIDLEMDESGESNVKCVYEKETVVEESMETPMSRTERGSPIQQPATEPAEQASDRNPRHIGSDSSSGWPTSRDAQTPSGSPVHFDKHDSSPSGLVKKEDHGSTRALKRVSAAAFGREVQTGIMSIDVILFCQESENDYQVIR